MNNSRSFAEILEEMTKDPVRNASGDGVLHHDNTSANGSEVETGYDFEDTLYRLKDSLPRGQFKTSPYVKHNKFESNTAVHSLASAQAVKAKNVKKPPVEHEPIFSCSALSTAGQTALSLLAIEDTTINMRTLQKAYRRLVRQHHPDLNKGSNGADQLVLVTQAYELLRSELRELKNKPEVKSPQAA